MAVPAVVAAGDRGAAKAVHGESKAFLEIEGRTLIEYVVGSLQRVPEVSEVWVVGDSARLAEVLGRPRVQAELTKPLHVLEQFEDLLANLWQSYRRLLPGAGPEGRDPLGPEDEERWVLYLSGDLPFATPQEISSFIRRAQALPCDYALGLVPEAAMECFLPSPSAPGIRMASFNLREGRFRQNNLHLVKPALLRNREAIEEMYRHRHQKQLGQIATLGWNLLFRQGGGWAVLWYYGLMHVAGLADRRGLRWLANLVRRFIPMPRIERSCSALLGTRFRFCATEVGGAALDIDNDEDFDVARLRFGEWRAAQEKRAESLHGPLPLAAETGRGSGSR